MCLILIRKIKHKTEYVMILSKTKSLKKCNFGAKPTRKKLLVGTKDKDSIILNYINEIKLSISEILNKFNSLSLKFLHDIVLYNFVNTNNFNVLSTPGPTYWPSSPTKKFDILNIFIAKIPSNLHCLTKNILYRS